MRRLIISLSVLVPGTANLLSQSIGYDSNATPNTTSISVSGIVVDNSVNPVVGASLWIKEDLKKHDVSDSDGKFYLSDVSDNSTIYVSYIGLSPQETNVSPEKRDAGAE